MRRVLAVLVLALSALTACDNGDGDTDTDDLEPHEQRCMDLYSCSAGCGDLYTYEGQWPPPSEETEAFHDCRNDCVDALLPGGEDDATRAEFDVMAYTGDCSIEHTEQGEPAPPCDDTEALVLCTG